MKISRTLVKDLSIPVLTTAIGMFAGSWLLIQYQQPQVVYYTDEYYSKIGSLLVGSIFIVNEGRSPETNLTISISQKVLPEDVDISFLSTKASIAHEDSRTQITLPKLKPYESAEIVFRSRSDEDTFKIEDVTSDSGNIRREGWVKAWWNFTKLQAGILVLVATFMFAVGFSIGLIKNDFFTKPKRGS